MSGGLQTLLSTNTSVVTVLLLTAFDAINVTVNRPDLNTHSSNDSGNYQQYTMTAATAAHLGTRSQNFLGKS